MQGLFVFCNTVWSKVEYHEIYLFSVQKADILQEHITVKSLELC